MPTVQFTPEDLRKPFESMAVLIRNEDAPDCDGTDCGNYREENGRVVKPPPHSHLIFTGQDPMTTSWCFAISKSL